MNNDFFHNPVLTNECLNFLITDRDGFYLDCTLGGGGHVKAILDNTSEQAKAVGIDRDPDALVFAGRRLANYRDRFKAVRGNFSEIKNLLGTQQFSGILFDLGISSYQLDTPERGFSYNRNGPLDMRMDPDIDCSAAGLINKTPLLKLDRLFKEFGEERLHKKAAKAICKERAGHSLKTTWDLKRVLEKSGLGHPKSLSRIFQAVRIAVNQELSSLQKALNDSLSLLKKTGNLVVITYHSLEDRIVKQFMKDRNKADLIILTKKPLRPGEDEITANKRSRSAKMRVAQKI
ncbi:MAG: 16S rRNA (cytosine(1402)-N(4))-methyltransferase RsmH [bacterium]